MDATILIALGGLVLAILAHAGATVLWAGRITEALRNVNLNLSRIDRELEKRDEQIAAVWKRIDAIRDMIPTSGVK